MVSIAFRNIIAAFRLSSSLSPLCLYAYAISIDLCAYITPSRFAVAAARVARVPYSRASNRAEIDARAQPSA